MECFDNKYNLIINIDKVRTFLWVIYKEVYIDEEKGF